ncbi:MAG: ribosome maturation factor RimP [Butyrivibrio sp.]|nr:ribosome maturation factor RimP [Butyrivibrio sp.]
MAKREEYEARATELILPIVRSNNYELVDLEYVKEGSSNYLRAYIDKTGGITVDDCEIVSRAFSDRLDEADFISESYILEVSSPGLGRPFKKDKDFERNIGEEVELKLFKPIEHKKDFVGLLKAFDKDTVTLELEDGKEAVFERRGIALIRQTVYF